MNFEMCSVRDCRNCCIAKYCYPSVTYHTLDDYCINQPMHTVEIKSSKEGPYCSHCGQLKNV